MIEVSPYILTKEDTKGMIEDVSKGITYLLIIHLLSHFINNDESLMQEKPIRQILYLVVAIVFYYIVIKRNVIELLFPEN